MAKRIRRAVLFDPSEHSVQVQLVIALAYMLRPEIYFFAIPNQSNRHINNAMKMQAEGVRSGVADLCFMFPADEGSIGWLEMKKKRGGTLRTEQKGFRAICARLGHRWAMAKSIDEAIDILRGWNALKPGAVIL